jgi:hypothetical protein
MFRRNFASILRVVRSENVPHDGRGREPLAAASPVSFLSQKAAYVIVTVVETSNFILFLTVFASHSTHFGVVLLLKLR